MSYAVIIYLIKLFFIYVTCEYGSDHFAQYHLPTVQLDIN